MRRLWIKLSLVLSFLGSTASAVEMNRTIVELPEALDEKVPGTSHYKEYKSLTYVMRRSFTSDFDF